MVQERPVAVRKPECWVRWSRRAALRGCALTYLLAAGLGCDPLFGAQRPSTTASADLPPSFEVATIKPSRPDDNDHGWHSNSDRVRIENYTLRDLIVSAYGLKSKSQALGGPDWIDKKHFDISAKVDETEMTKMKTMTRDDRRKQWNLMMQALLADRFGLSVKREIRRSPVYLLVVTKSGARLTDSTPDEKNHDLSVQNTAMTATAVSMDSLANYLTTQFEVGDRVVLNRTGISGDYDFKLNWAPDRGQGIQPDAVLPGLFTALKEQLGLELKPDKAPVDVVVVRSAAEPELD